MYAMQNFKCCFRFHKMQRKTKKYSKPEGDIEKAERLRAKVRMAYICIYILHFSTICVYESTYVAISKATHVHRYVRTYICSLHRACV